MGFKNRGQIHDHLARIDAENCLIGDVADLAVYCFIKASTLSVFALIISQ